MMNGTWRELDYRQAEGGRLPVRLLWNQLSHNLAVEVNDHDVEWALGLRDPSRARNAFIHPFRIPPLTRQPRTAGKTAGCPRPAVKQQRATTPA